MAQRITPRATKTTSSSRRLPQKSPDSSRYGGGIRRSLTPARGQRCAIPTRSGNVRRIFLSVARGPPSRPVIVVLEAHDVVLAEIAAGLYLDQFKVDLAGIFEAMPGPVWHVERLVLVQERDVVPDRHPRGAAHDHPVLGA